MICFDECSNISWIHLVCCNIHRFQKLASQTANWNLCETFLDDLTFQTLVRNTEHMTCLDECSNISWIPIVWWNLLGRVHAVPRIARRKLDRNLHAANWNLIATFLDGSTSKCNSLNTWQCWNISWFPICCFHFHRFQYLASHAANWNLCARVGWLNTLNPGAN